MAVAGKRPGTLKGAGSVAKQLPDGFRNRTIRGLQLVASVLTVPVQPSPVVDSSLADQAAARLALHDWLSSSYPGRAIVTAEQARIRQLLPNLFGYHLLQVGRIATADLLSTSRILNRIVVEIDTPPSSTASFGLSPGLSPGSSPGLSPGSAALRYPTVHGRAADLPVESDSVDVVVAPHILEFEAEPHEALRESFRVLVAEGHLILSGFNPWSLLGLGSQIGSRFERRGGLARFGPGPCGARPLPPIRIREWLSVLGFDIRSQAGFWFKPPVNNEQVLARLEFMDRYGPRALPFLAGVYVILARKRVTKLTPIKPHWRLRRRLAGVGLAGPAAKVGREAVAQPAPAPRGATRRDCSG